MLGLFGGRYVVLGVGAVMLPFTPDAAGPAVVVTVVGGTIVNRIYVKFAARRTQANDVSDDDAESDWQRRYDEAITRERVARRRSRHALRADGN